MVIFDYFDYIKYSRIIHKNPVLKQIYKDFLGEPNGELAHKLLHTHYSKKDKYRFVK